MAVKFSDFSPKTLVSDVTEVVGYLTSGELNVRIPPANLDTTYAVSTGNAGASPTINLQGTKPGQPAITPSTVSLTGSGATLLNGNGSTTIDFASTAYALSATDNADPAQNTPVVLTGTGGGDAGTDTINIIGSGTVGVTSSSGTITITGSGGGGGGGVTSFTNTNGTFISAATANTGATGAVTTGVIDLSATGSPSASTFLRGDNTWATPAGGFSNFDITGDSGTAETVNSGDTVTIAGGTVLSSTVTSPATITVNHNGVTRTDTTSSDSPSAGGTVDLVKTITTSTEGHVTAVDVSTVTWPAGGAPTISKTQLTGNNSTTVFALTGAPAGLTVANLNIFISGVYQNQKDTGGTDNYSVGSGASPNLTFVTAPPVTAANGIDVVITS
tara:strand:+ start:6484 stop:7647 length:1164 start_codon:yes stop_codon:yes gene_type:complete